MNAEIPPRWGSLKELCQQYPFARTRAYELLHEGKLRAKKFGDRTVWDFSSADELFASLPNFKRGE
jgi:hypothetical protein